MIALKHRLHIAVLALALTLTAGINPASADTLKVPKEKTEFVMDFPDGWTHQMEKDGTIVCLPPDKSKGFYILMVLDLPDVHSKAEVKKQLPVLAKDFAASQKITGVETAEIEDLKNTNGVPFTGFVGSGTDKDGKTPVIVVLHAFEPKKGKWYVVVTLGSEAADKAYSDDYETITDSIQPLK